MSNVRRVRELGGPSRGLPVDPLEKGCLSDSPHQSHIAHASSRALIRHRVDSARRCGHEGETPVRSLLSTQRPPSAGKEEGWLKRSMAARLKLLRFELATRNSCALPSVRDRIRCEGRCPATTLWRRCSTGVSGCSLPSPPPWLTRTQWSHQGRCSLARLSSGIVATTPRTFELTSADRFVTFVPIVFSEGNTNTSGTDRSIYFRTSAFSTMPIAGAAAQDLQVRIARREVQVQCFSRRYRQPPLTWCQPEPVKLTVRDFSLRSATVASTRSEERMKQCASAEDVG